MIKEKAHAKINLFLNVISRREDGYHEMEMVMTPLELHDVLKFEKIDQDIVEIKSNKQITEDMKDNIMYKAAQFIRNKFEIDKGVRIHIEKNIPIAGGLAGGSADAAATIRGLNKLFKLGMTLDDMADLGGVFGADVPFCVYNKLAIVRGIGEKLQFIDAKLKAHVLLVNPRVPVSTRDVFINLNPKEFALRNYGELVEALINRDTETVIDNLYNFMEPTTFKLEPRVKDVKDELQELGIKGVLMSGSGGTVFVLCRKKKKLEETVSLLNKGYFTVLTKAI